VSEIALNRLTLSWRLDDHEGHEYEVLWFAVCCRNYVSQFFGHDLRRWKHLSY
jgi:hypothetical protein